jgi:hypothetical protein
MSGRAAWRATLIAWSWAALAAANPLPTPLSGEAAPATISAPAARCVRLVWRDLSRGLGTLVPAVRGEVAQIFAPLDVTLDWRTATPEEPLRDGEIAIVVLERPRGALPARVMGAVDRKTQRQAWIFLSGIRHRLTREATERAVAPVDPAELARLTGRVIAHEIVHVMAPRLGHTAEGLMQAEWSRAVALQPRLSLDAQSVRAVVAAVDPSVSKHPSPRPERDAVAGETVPDDAVDLL